MTLCVMGFGTSSQGELHMPNLSVKPLPPGKADVTLHELVMVPDWVSRVSPAVPSSHIFKSLSLRWHYFYY